VRAARIGDKVIEGLSNKLAFDETLNNVKLWTIICNRAFFHVFWNSDDFGVTGFKPVKPEETSAEQLVPQPGMPIANPESPMEPEVDDGDVCIECVSPFNCRVDPLYFDREKWRWFMYGDEVDAGILEEKYELEPGSLHETSNTLETSYDLELQDEQDLIIGEPSRDEKVVGRTVVYKELWTPRVYIFMAGDQVLDYGENKYKEIPFFAVEDRLIPISTYEKEFTYNESLVKDAIPVQREYNRQASIVSLAIDRASKLKILTPMGSLISKKQWVNDYGVFIDYNPSAGTPFQPKFEAFPIQVPEYQARLEREMGSIMSLGPASFGELPERASHASGTLVNLLLEQDDVVLNPLLNHINRVTGQVWSLAMRLVQDNYLVSRLVKITGEGGEDDVLKFKGAMLKGNTDVRVVSQSGLPRSRALRIEYVMKLREVGLLTDDRSTLEMLEFGNAEKIFKDSLLHEKKAYRENNAIINNPNVDPASVIAWVYPYEDHQAHIKIHLRLRLSPQWDKLSEMQKAAHEQHIAATVETLQAQMAPPTVPEPGATANEPATQETAGPSQQ
jgi:hypothetical protein